MVGNHHGKIQNIHLKLIAFIGGLPGKSLEKPPHLFLAIVRARVESQKLKHVVRRSYGFIFAILGFMFPQIDNQKSSGEP